MFGGLDPSAVVHGQHGELRFADDQHVGVVPCVGGHGALGEGGLRLVDLAGEQLRLAEERSAWSRHGLQVGSEAIANSASAIACSGPPAHMSERSIARADSNDAEPSSGVRS